jgi:hypothetical protein
MAHLRSTFAYVLEKEILKMRGVGSLAKEHRYTCFLANAINVRTDREKMVKRKSNSQPYNMSNYKLWL